MLACLFMLAACSHSSLWDKMPWNKNDGASTEALWESATHTSDKTFGEGSKPLTVKVEVQENSVTFTINTDKATVGEALIEHRLIEGEVGAYGLYIKKVNGIEADFNVDQSYWSFYIGEDYALTGVDQTEIDEGAVYRLVYTK